MITIAVCDDSEAVLTNLSSLIQKYARETNQDIKIFKYSSGVQLLDKYMNNYDIIFLDIKMPNMNGLETASKIRKHDKSVSIVFLTSFAKYALNGYDVDASNYIIKPITYKRLKMELEAWNQKHIINEEPFLIIKNDNGSYKVILKELAFIETLNRKALIHTKTENFVCYKKMKQLEAELMHKGFSRCHSSYIINLAYIENIEGMDAKLITGERIPISKTKKKEFMQGLARYWGERI